jgi:hypothetical protein
MTTNLIKIPKAFYIDHIERDLDAPEIVKRSARHFHVAANDPAAVAELLSDANHYSDCAGPGWCVGAEARDGIGLQSSARATAKAIIKHFGKDGYINTRGHLNAEASYANHPD